MTATAGAGVPVRLYFELSRDDNPRLYDDLIRFNKGTKRVNRLRFLAHEGLAAQFAHAGNSGATPAAPPDRLVGVDEAVAHQTNQAFDQPPVSSG